MGKFRISSKTIVKSKSIFLYGNWLSNYMNIISKEEYLQNKKKYTELIKNGAVFIYPTDTIYGIGCDAGNKKAVEKVRNIKKRPDMPFSIIAPNKNWIVSNFEMTTVSEEWINKLPGPYTLILNISKNIIANNVNPTKDTLGIRIPDNWFSKEINELDIPIITTSANITGENFMETIEDLDIKIKNKVDFIIYQGPIHGKPSTVVNLTSEIPDIKER